MEKYREVRDTRKWGKPEFVYKDVKEFEETPDLVSGIHTVMHAGVPIDILIDLQPGTPLCFIFKGNTRRKSSSKLPVFVGFSIVSARKATRVSISDPGMYLHPSIGLAWYAGGKDCSIQTVLPRIIQKIVAASAPTKVMMIGGSGGGHAAMYYSRYVKDSLAVVWNPQNDFLNYEENGVMAYVSKAFGVNSLEEAKSTVPLYVNTELSVFYKKTPTTNYVVYLQNIVDSHVEKHCKPFMASLGHHISSPLASSFVGDNTYLYFSGNWGGDHEPPPKEFLVFISNALLDYEGSWAQLIQERDIAGLLEQADSICLHKSA